jgi:hypothetical protein
MKTRTLLVALVALLLLLAGVMGYRRAAARNAADCADKPKPQNEFALAAECDGGAAPAGQTPASPKPEPAPAPK